MQEITRKTRREAYHLRPMMTRQEEILCILGSRTMTARQIAVCLGFDDLNGVKPRLTELSKKGIIEAVGKTWDPLTGRNVAQWKRTEVRSETV